MVLDLGTSVHALKGFLVFLRASQALCEADNNFSPQFDGVLVFMKDLVQVALSGTAPA